VRTQQKQVKVKKCGLLDPDTSDWQSQVQTLTDDRKVSAADATEAWQSACSADKSKGIVFNTKCQ
jgi:hypothetical protein